MEPGTYPEDSIYDYTKYRRLREKYRLHNPYHRPAPMPRRRSVNHWDSWAYQIGRAIRDLLSGFNPYARRRQ